MAPLRFPNIKPKEHISQKVSLSVLREVLRHIFSQAVDGLWLVGGTALAGYYAEHRRSDDLDLFAMDATAHRACILAVKSLAKKGAQLSNERTSPYYHHVDIQFKNHTFTIDCVLDENLHRIGNAIKTGDGVWVADLPTLFTTKAACLVSRCSEKDLFDLDWLVAHAEDFHISDLVTLGFRIDGGLTVETLLISINGARLNKERCHFLPPKSSLTVEKAYKKIISLQKKFIEDLLEYEKTLPLSEEVKNLSRALKDQKKLR